MAYTKTARQYANAVIKHKLLGEDGQGLIFAVNPASNLILLSATDGKMMPKHLTRAEAREAYKDAYAYGLRPA